MSGTPSTEMASRIAAGLERAFASEGFARPSVEELRVAAGVSLRTLYRYAPSRDAMVRAALEHRHERYLDRLFTDLPSAPERVLSTLVDRVAAWMADEASHGCLFHAAVAVAPRDARLRALLDRHKAEVAARATHHAGVGEEQAVDIMLILEGLTQSWPLSGEAAVASARRLIGQLRSTD